MDTVGVGLVGCGNMGQLHAASLAALARAGEAIHPVAAADPSRACRDAAARNWPFTRLHSSSAAVIEDPDVDVVFVCTPTVTHRDLFLAVFDAGKHLYAEKPLAGDFDVVREICAAAATSEGIHQVGFQMRRHSLLAHVKDLATTGELGPPMAYSVRDDEYFPTSDLDPNVSDWRSDRERAGGGTLLEHSIHGIDLAHWLFGSPVRVSAATRHVLGYGVEDTAAVVVEHDSGVVGTVVSIFGGVVGREESRMEVFFRDGIVEVTWGVLVDDPLNALRIQRADHPAEMLDNAVLLSRVLSRAGLHHQPFFWNELAAAAFLSSVRTGKPATPGFGDALVAHATIEAAYRAGAGGLGADVRALLA